MAAAIACVNLLLVLALSWRAWKAHSILIVFWLFNSLYGVHFLILTAAPEVLLSGAGDNIWRFFDRNNVAAVSFVVLVNVVIGVAVWASQKVAAAAGYRLQPYYSSETIAMRFDWAVVLLIIFALEATVAVSNIGVTDYESFVSGGQTSAGLTLAYMSSSAVVLAFATQSTVLFRIVCFGVGGLACILVSLQTGVRLFALFPLGAAGIGYAFSLKGNKNYGRVIWGAGLAAVLGGYLSTSAFEVRQTKTAPADSIVAASALAYFGVLHPDYFEFENAMSRIFSGLLSYPSSRIGSVESKPREPAHAVAQAELGPWVTDYHHYPATLAFDLWLSSGWVGGVGVAICIGFFLALLDLIMRASPVASVLFVPSMVVFQYSLARGAVFGAGATISACVAFQFLTLIALIVAQSLGGGRKVMP